jgi:hypothetical protein
MTGQPELIFSMADDSPKIPGRFAKASGLEIQRGFAGIQVSGNGDVIVHDQPFAFDLAQSAGGGNPYVGFLPFVSVPLILSRPPFPA